MRYSVASIDENQGHTPYELLALLLLLGSPFAFTFRKLVELFGLTERSHQFVNELGDDNQMPPCLEPANRSFESVSYYKRSPFS